MSFSREDVNELISTYPQTNLWHTKVGRVLWDTCIAPSLEYGMSQNVRINSFILETLFGVEYANTSAEFFESVKSASLLARPLHVPMPYKYIIISNIKAYDVCFLCGIKHHLIYEIKTHDSVRVGRNCGNKYIAVLNLLNMLHAFLTLKSKKNSRDWHVKLMSMVDKCHVALGFESRTDQQKANKVSYVTKKRGLTDQEEAEKRGLTLSLDGYALDGFVIDEDDDDNIDDDDDDDDDDDYYTCKDEKPKVEKQVFANIKIEQRPELRRSKRLRTHLEGFSYKF